MTIVSNITSLAKRKSFEDDFYQAVICKLVRSGKISTKSSVLVTAGGLRDKETWLASDFMNVTISNLDDRMVGDEFAPLKWSFLDAERISLPDNSFDYVCIHNGLHHCGCPQAAVLDMLRVARKGILLFEPYDNLVTRIGARLGISQKYETAAVFYSGYTHGGLRNGPVANYIYRFTKWELEKTVSTAFPEGPVKLEFMHAFRMPWEQLQGRSNKLAYYVACLARPLLSVATMLFPEQGNCFAAFITKRSENEALWPWVDRSADGSLTANTNWLTKKYKKIDG